MTFFLRLLKSLPYLFKRVFEGLINYKYDFLTLLFNQPRLTNSTGLVSLFMAVGCAINQML